MDHTALKLYAVNAVILAFREHRPSRRQVRKWKDNNVKIAFIHPNNGFDSEQQENEDLKELIDVEYVLEDAPLSVKNADAYFLRSSMKKLNTPSGKTVLLTDDPRYFPTAETKRMAMAIGIESSEGKGILYENGATIVLDSLDNITVTNGNNNTPGFSQMLPNLFTEQHKFESIWKGKKPIFFFDYDGTLTPIVKNPDEALLDDEMRELLQEISHMFHVAVISGRDMDDIKKFIRLDSLIYAGSHGFRISGPGGLYMEHEKARKLLGSLEEIEKSLRKKFEGEIPGIQIERKQYAIALHYRNAPDEVIPGVKKMLNELIQGYPNFKTGKGKKILEVKPSMDWHKGKAVKWILEELGLDLSTEYIPVYIGDDVTDEDAFRTLIDDGVGILVGEHGKPSAARYRLGDVDQVKQFMHYIVHSGQFPKNY